MADERVGLSGADGDFCLTARNDKSDRDQVYRQGSLPGLYGQLHSANFISLKRKPKRRDLHYQLRGEIRGS